jgi:hypothetical protein
MKKLISFLFIFTSVLFITACGQEADAPPKEPVQEQKQEDETPQSEAPKEPEEEKKTFQYTAPLTGLGTNEKLPKRIVMVLINNAPAARPQSGLDKADIVYEILSEGSITRFVAIYHSQKPDVIGPVRSIRPYFIEVGNGFDAIMVHAGGSPAALNTLTSKGMAHLDEIYNAGNYFWRESFRKPPHNLYTDLDRIWSGSKVLGFRMEAEIPALSFISEDQENQGEPASKVDVTYMSQYKVSYEYDETLKRYKRFTQGKPHHDLTTDQQLAADNLLVITSPHKILDNVGRRDVDVSGPGEGLLFQRGKGQKITWERKDGLIRAYTAEGKEVPMYPGNTWVNLIPTVPSLKENVQYQ